MSTNTVSDGKRKLTSNTPTKKAIIGFSLIELLVTIAIVTAIALIAMPSYHDFIHQTQMKSEVNKWLLGLNVARQTAITSNAIITLCPSDNGQYCGKDWHKGAIIFTDQNKDHNRTDDELLVQTIAPIKSSFTLTWRAFQNRNYIQFKQNGFTWDQNGTLRLCSKQTSLKFNRALIVTRAGRIRLSTDENADGIHEDAKGVPINCN